MNKVMYLIDNGSFYSLFTVKGIVVMIKVRRHHLLVEGELQGTSQDTIKVSSKYPQSILKKHVFPD